MIPRYSAGEALYLRLSEAGPPHGVLRDPGYPQVVDGNQHVPYGAQLRARDAV
jgi:hypothetical protein